MSKQVLYRKYRSGSFAEVIGQDHIVRTLTTALATDRVAHAYLFTGPRGTGKTSVARLLAKAVNCTGEPKPCGACQLCQLAPGAALDIIEIDAASNRSIDSIRELRDKIALAPTVGRRKVYIIDEVHMLTNEAFNALLKTLEEPPAHAMFILATTEAHKIPETIVSRTQRLAFKPITQTALVEHLQSIAGRESINVEPAALAMIARASRGGFRDAISALDQLASAEPANITAATVRELLGYSSQDELVELAEGLVNRQTGRVLELASRLQAEGAAPAQTALGLIELWRGVIHAAAGVPGASETYPANLANAGLHRMATIIATLIDVSRSAWPEMALEAALVTLTTDPQSTAPASQPSAGASTPAAPAANHSRPVAAPQNTPATPVPQSASTAESLSADLWPKVLVSLKAKNNSLAALLQMYQTEFKAGEIIIKARFNFHRDLFLKPANRTIIETTASKVYGQPVKIQARTDEDPAAKQRSHHKSNPNAELVSSALEILGGEVVD